MKRTIAFYLIFILVASCSNGNDNESEIPFGTNLRVNYFKVDCTGVSYQECFLVQEGEELGTEDWHYFYSPIEDFEFESGFIYNLQVGKETIQNPPEDGSSIKYKLTRLISKESVTCSFNDPVKDLDWLRFEVEKRMANINGLTKYCYITQANLDGKPVFLYWDCNPAINKVIPIFDCLGNNLGNLGYEINLEDLKNQTIVWQPEEFVCNPNF